VHVYDLEDSEKFIDEIKSKFERRIREIVE